MAFIDTLKAKNKPELRKLAAEWGAVISAAASKEDILRALVLTPEAERANMAAKTEEVVREQCKVRGIEDPAPVLAKIEADFGAPVKELLLPELNRLNRNMASVMEGFLGGHKRNPTGKRLPAGLEV